ncbi:MAG: PfkB family carbohydrate kinase, partial [Planctomycetota bacterium]
MGPLHEHQRPSLTVVGLGEALFDCFPSRQVLGGAPLNLAYHADQLLHAHRGRGVVVSRVGEDSLGQELRRELAVRGLTREFVQSDASLPTGQVRVEISSSAEPVYQVVSPVAWDHLRFESSLAELSRSCRAVCFGSLAQRAAASRETIQRFLREATQAIRCFDVNLRPPFVESDVLRSSLQLATVAKLNAEELGQVCQLLKLTVRGSCVADGAQAIREAFGLHAVAVTRGAAGTQLHLADRIIEGQVPHYASLANGDAVGAGDACCAGLL